MDELNKDEQKEIERKRRRYPFSDKSEDNVFEHFRYVADPKQTQVRIDLFLMDKLEKITRNRLQKAIRDGGIRVNEEQVRPNYKIRPGDVITVLMPEPPNPNKEVEPENIPLDIVYEDDHLMVINKPAGMVVHPGVGNYDGTLVNAIAYHLKDQNLPFRDEMVSRPGLVHRIDKETSGLLVIAKNEHAMSHLADQFFHHTSSRKYIALVWGSLEEQEGTIDMNIGRDPISRMHQRTFEEGDFGKRAVTHWKVLEDLYYVSVVECQLETGRTHQIRVHMKHLGNTIFNDKRYGGDAIKKGTVYTKYKQFVQNCFDLMPRQGLHAKSLGFDHPVTGERMNFDSELPEDFVNCLEKWRNYLNTRKGKLA